MPELREYARRSWQILIPLIILTVMIANCFRGKLGLSDLIALRSHQALLEMTRDKLITDNDRLSVRIHQLQSDDRYIESAIRSELGYSRPGEIVYRFADTSAPNP
jgi:cell division protein FtsB